MKRNLQLLSSLLLAVLLIFALASCTDEKNNGACTNHDYGTEFTVTDEGHEYKCKNEGCEETKTEVHFFGSVVEKTAATCTAEGVGTKTCISSECNYSTDVTIPKKAHDYNNVEWSFDETYETQNHWKKCKNCDERTAIAEHNYANIGRDNTHHWMTCTCGAKGQVEEHTWSSAEDPDNTGKLILTCTNPACAHVLKNVDDPNHEHAWVDGDVTLDPTCTSTGTQAQSCACGATGEKTLNMLDHSFNSGAYYHSETHHWQNCSCGELAATEDKVPHDFGDEFVREGDFKVYTCVCDEQKKVPVEGYIDPNGWT